jgi:hypothetical protein
MTGYLFFGGGAALAADVEDVLLAVAGAAALDLKQGGCLHQVAELGISPGPRVEVQRLLGDDLPDRCQGRPAVVGGRLDGVAELGDQAGVALQLGRGRPCDWLLGGFAGCRLSAGAARRQAVRPDGRSPPGNSRPSTLRT